MGSGSRMMWANLADPWHRRRRRRPTGGWARRLDKDTSVGNQCNADDIHLSTDIVYCSTPIVWRRALSMSTACAVSSAEASKSWQTYRAWARSQQRQHGAFHQEN